MIDLSAYIALMNQNNSDLLLAAMQKLLAKSSDMIFVKDIHLKYVAASIPFVRMVGKEKMQEIIDKTDLEIFEDKDLARRYVSDDYKLLENFDIVVSNPPYKKGQTRKTYQKALVLLATK